MKIVEYVAIPGTGGLNREGEWSEPTSPFSTFALGRGFVNLAARASMPFMWSTDLDFGAGHHNDWRAGGAALFYYLSAPGRPDLRIPGVRTFIIAHSWGGATAIYAAAYGLKIECLVTIGMPQVPQMDAVYADARRNIKRHLHLYSRRDWWQVLGGLFDRRLGVVRACEGADRNEVMPKGHGDILRDPKLFPQWVDRGWFDYIAHGDGS